MSRRSQKENLPRRLTLPFILEDGRVPGLVSRMLYLTCGLIAALVVWASVTEIRELAIASGQLQPVGSVQRVQHLEGGIVSEILVSEGELVDAGMPMVRLQPISAGSDLAQTRVRAAALAMQVERQSATLEGRTADFGALALEFPDLARNQIDLFNSERLQLAQQKDSLISRVEQKFAEVQAFDAQLESLELQLEINREQLAIREDLLEQGFSSRSAVLDVRREYENTNADVISVRGDLRSAQEALNEARINLLELDSEYNNRLTDERARAGAELAELNEALTKQEDRVDRLVIVSPIHGIVQDLLPTAIGQVIQPGELVAEVVPLDQELVAEVRIDPRDIGHVRVGLDAEVKVTTFDPARFGSITGEVRQISASTLQNEEGEPYYRAIVGLESNFVGFGGARHMVLPGMVVNVEIVTGSKSLVRYLLKPVFRSLDVAFSER